MGMTTRSGEAVGRTAAPINGAVPPLENGDRLTRAEFERRYDAMPHLKKAELIEGEVYMPSPVRYEGHCHPHSLFVTWLTMYAIHTPGVGSADNGSVRLDQSNEPQPDGFLIIRPERGGQSRISADDYIEGAPELVGEVAPSTVSIDSGKKKDAYRRNGVREYIVWRVLDGELDWFVNRDGTFERLAPGAVGNLRSLVFPGLWLDPAALVRGDYATVFAVGQRGIDSSEHTDFVARLAQGRIA